MLSCREVTELVATDAVTTAGWRTRMAVRLHQLMCRHCRRYARQLKALGKAVRSFGLDQPLSESENALLERLERAARQAPGESGSS